jgi:uncharacterized protein (TIGR02266 family)
MSLNQWDEKRKFKRYASDLPVRFGDLHAPPGEAQEGMALNICRGGIFIKTKTPLRAGTDIQLYVRIVSPFGQEQTIEAEAKVMWASETAAEPGMGVSFTKIDRHSQYAMLACAFRGET